MDSKIVITKPNVNIEIIKNVNNIELKFNYHNINYYSLNLLKNMIIILTNNPNIASKKYRVVKEYARYKEIISNDFEDLISIFESNFNESEINYLKKLLESLS
jgi:hypothetical protein